MTTRHSEAAFETVIEAHLLWNGYMPVARERTIPLLEEHRAALIAATVTGQPDVGEFAA
jgi:hypothetical protein